MKLKEFFYWLGIKPKPVEYGIQITDQELPGYGNIQYANWLHPKMRQNNLDINKINVLKRFLSPGDVAIDIGAHVGDTSIEMALAVGRLGTVFAFEPNCHVFRILEKNASLNPDYCNIIPFMFAATDSDAELTFNYSDPGFCNGGEFLDVSNLRHAHLFPLSVSGRNVSSLLLQKYPEAMAKLKYIKIDTEGADYRVFKTLEPLVRNTHPYVRSEINRHMPAQERFEYWKYITSLNYSVVLSDSDDGPSERILSEENILNPKTFDIWAIPNTK